MERSYKLYRDFSDKWGKDGNWVIDLANVMFLFAILADAAIKRHRIQMAYGVTEFFESIAAKGCFNLYLSYFYFYPLNRCLFVCPKVCFQESRHLIQG